MALINTTGIMKPVHKLGGAIIAVVQPAANLLEIAAMSSESWAQRYSADLAAKDERAEAVRVQTHKDLLRKALAQAQQTSLQTNVFEREVQAATALDSFKDRIHTERCKTIMEISPDQISILAKRENLTDSDILRAAKVGYQAKALGEEDAVASPFDLTTLKDRVK